MSTPDSPNKPDAACITCPPPREDQPWRLADRGYLTCAGCLDRIREALKDIAKRYEQLDPAPGASGEHGSRGAPGFGSRAPASEHVIVMTDWRSKSCEVSSDGVQYVWDPLADTTLEPGQYGPPAGAYVAKREVWYGADGRGHAEQERPPRSIPAALSSLASLIAEERDLTDPRQQVSEITRWLDQQLDWLTRQPLVVDVWAELRELVAQLKPVTGDPGRRHIGLCPVVIDEGEHTRECGARLYAPLKGDEIECRSCGEVWPREKWLRLGDLLEAS